MESPWKIKWHQAVIALLIGFGAGTVFGQWQAQDNFHQRWKRGGMREHMLKRFSSELHLSPEQQTQVAAIFDAQHPKMTALQAETRPKFEALRNEVQAEVRKILMPDQLPDFEKMNAKMQERWKNKEKFFAS